MAGSNGTRIAVAILACGVFAAPAHAYLDPGTGSIILQSILAGIAVAMGVLRLYWYRLKAFFSGKNAKPDVQDSQESEIKNES